MAVDAQNMHMEYQVNDTDGVKPTYREKNAQCHVRHKSHVRQAWDRTGPSADV